MPSFLRNNRNNPNNMPSNKAPQRNSSNPTEQSTNLNLNTSKFHLPAPQSP